MENNTIFSASLKNYKSIVWQNQAMYSNYQKLKNHLKKNLNEECASLFSEPHISAYSLKGDANATWSSDLISANAVPFNTLSDVHKAKIKDILAQKMNSISEYAQKKLNSNDAEDNNWGNLIEKALVIPDDSHIMVEGDNTVFVAWGFIYELVEKQGYNLIKSFPRNTFTKENEEKQTHAHFIPEEPKIITKNEKTVIEYNTEANTITNENNQYDNNPIEENSAPATSKPEISPNTIKPMPPSIPPTNKDKKKGWKKFYWLWIIILILLLLLLLKMCSFKNNSLPPAPGVIVPIDTTKIVDDPHKVKRIISDRLNIALIGENKDLNIFANKFKEIYPGSDYKIIYYDTATFRIQIQLPPTELEKVKDELPTKLHDFEMLIWYEGIFENNYTPNDPCFRNDDQCWYQKEVKAPEAWELTRGKGNIVIAIIDDGFDLTHPEFRGKIYKPWNVVSSSANVNTGKNSIHGTHVAGIALALANNDAGIAGIAPECKFMPVQVGDYNDKMSTTAIIDGLLYAINHGANVINMSLGMAIPNSVNVFPPSVQREIMTRYFLDEAKLWDQIYQVAYKKNIIIVLAAGNSNVLVGVDPMQRSKYTIKVSAVDKHENKASFSNYGEFSTISAPGVHIYSSVPGNRYEYMDGTSMAAPVVSGGIALIKSINPAISFNQIVDLIQSTGTPVNSSAENIGNILQLDRALGIANQNRKKMPKVDCPATQNKIDSLLQEIEKLKQQCPGNAKGDTMRIPPNNKDFRFAIGRWKSTSYIYEIGTGDQVTIYFDFYDNGKGKITLLKNDNTECTAPLSLSLKPNMFTINQEGKAICDPPPTVFSPYLFVCKTGANNCAECAAQNKNHSSNSLKFNLIKIR